MKPSTSGEPNFLVKPFGDSRLAIYGPGSPEFDAYLSGPEKRDGLSSMKPTLPYSVIIANLDGSQVIGYSLVWTGNGKDGQVRRATQTIADTINLTGVLLHGSPVLISPVGPVIHSANLHGVQFPDRTAELREWVSLQESIFVELDAVVFADGETVGKDGSRLQLRMRSTLKAERDLLREIESTPADDSALEKWLNSLSDRSEIIEAGKARQIEGDEFRYRLAKAEAALDCLRMTETTDAGFLRDYARSTLARKSYPAKLVADA